MSDSEQMTLLIEIRDLQRRQVEGGGCISVFAAAVGVPVLGALALSVRSTPAVQSFGETTSTSQSMKTRTRGDSWRLFGYNTEIGVGVGGCSPNTSTSVPAARSST
jgi:hypothetical protein